MREIIRHVLDGFRSQEGNEVFILEKPLHGGGENHEPMGNRVEASHSRPLTLDVLLILLDQHPRR